jgi:hypothetical protein
MNRMPIRLEELEHSFLDDSKNGYISVTNNQIRVKDAEKLGKQPVLLESDSVDVYINGTQLKGSSVVFSHDEVTWSPRETGEFFKVWVTEDQLQAYFQLLKQPKVPKLKNVEKAISLRLELEDEISGSVQEFLAKINEAINKLGVRSPNIVAITQELLHPTFEPIVIAQGIPPQDGEDGWLETYFEHSTNLMLKETEGRINFRERRDIPSVEAGTVIAELHPPQPGKNGISVFGTPIEARNGREVSVRAGKNVELHRGKCIALRSGRPVVTGERVKLIDVQQVYHHKGNVNLESGNVYFNGDVVIHGDVEEDMHVEAFGNITVYGNVYKSTLIAAQSIYVTGTIFGSHLAGGKIGLFYSKVYKIIDEFLRQFHQLVESVDLVYQRFVLSGDKRASYGYLANLMINMKYPVIAALAKQFSQVMELAGKMVPPEIMMVDRMLEMFRRRELLQQKSTKQELLSISDYMAKLLEKIRESVYTESDIVISTANGTKLETTGNIIVIGSGTVQSELYAGNHIAYKLQESSCRGGRLVAGKKITVKDVVSGHRVYLEAGESISVHTCRDIRVVIHGAAMDVYDEYQNVMFVNRKGRIAMLPIPMEKK